MKGLAAIVGGLPSEIGEKVHEGMEETRELARVHCAGKRGIPYDLCEAKIFIELHPHLVEAIIVGDIGITLAEVTG
jgi:hypothetical protein